MANSSSTPPPASKPPTLPPTEAMQGVLLLAVLMDASLFGLVSQQFYTYWISGFRDPIYFKLFVIFQYLLVAFQNVLMWYFSYSLFIVAYCTASSTPVSLWEGPVNSLIQLFIIFSANAALTARIYGLTNNRLQSGMIIAFSAVAFVFGMITIIISWKSPSTAVSYTHVTLPVWRALQTVAECLITIFLVRALLKARSGIHASDSIVYCLVRNVIQTGFLASAWAIAALVTWFFLPRVSAYRIFDITSGAVYTQAVFESLLSRKRLREQMMIDTYLDLGVHTQQSQASGRFRITGKASKITPPTSDISGPDSGPGPRPSLNVLNTKCDVMELESLPWGRKPY